MPALDPSSDSEKRGGQPRHRQRLQITDNHDASFTQAGDRRISWMKCPPPDAIANTRLAMGSGRHRHHRVHQHQLRAQLPIQLDCFGAIDRHRELSAEALADRLVSRLQAVTVVGGAKMLTCGGDVAKCMIPDKL